MRQTPEPLDWNALRELRDLFLTAEPVDKPYWVSRGQLDAYDRTLGERIGWKWDAVLDELKLRGWSPPSRSLTDFGCGTGVATRRVLAAFPGSFDEVTLIDHSAIATAFARERIQRDHPGIPVRIENEGTPSGGVLLVSHVLNELPETARENLPETFSGADAVLWVEPGTSDCGKQLVAFRERMRGKFTLVAPCPHQGVCGLLAPENEGHWCHHFAPAPSAAHQDPFWGHFRREMNLDIGPVAYSFLAMDTSCEPAEGLSHLIGQPLRFPKFLRALSCQAEDVEELVASRRSGSVYRDLKEPACPAVYHFERRKNRVTGGKWLGGRE